MWEGQLWGLLMHLLAAVCLRARMKDAPGHIEICWPRGIQDCQRVCSKQKNTVDHYSGSMLGWSEVLIFLIYPMRGGPHLFHVSESTGISILHVSERKGAWFLRWQGPGKELGIPVEVLPVQTSQTLPGCPTPPTFPFLKKQRFHRRAEQTRGWLSSESVFTVVSWQTCHLSSFCLLKLSS